MRGASLFCLLRSTRMRGLLVALVVGSLGCSLDPYLTCGEKCTDASAIPDATLDVTLPGDAAAADVAEATVPVDAMMDGPAPGCRQIGAACSTKSDCCQGLLCDTMKCAQCRGQGAACVDDWQCCSGNCDVPSDAGKLCSN